MMWETKPFYGHPTKKSKSLWYVKNGAQSYKESGTVKYYSYRPEAEEKAAELNGEKK